MAAKSLPAWWPPKPGAVLLDENYDAGRGLVTEDGRVIWADGSLTPDFIEIEGDVIHGDITLVLA